MREQKEVEKAVDRVITDEKKEPTIIVPADPRTESEKKFDEIQKKRVRPLKHPLVII